jgi:glycosyltransferase involved in cell wall biosynthesis
MTHPFRVLFVSTFPPQQCGIATFTQHLIRGLPSNGAVVEARVAALIRKVDCCEFRSRVVHRVQNGRPGAYRDLAAFVNDSDFDAVSVQHEYGLFSGEWGRDLLEFLDRCERPVVTTLHTILPQPNRLQREVLQAVAARSARVVTMARVGIDLLDRVYGVPRKRCVFIAHGVPSVEGIDREAARRKLGLEGRKVLLTFGLLSRGKGIEHMIDALAELRRRHPEVLYLVVGHTHPNIVRLEGESYRESLRARARELGLTGHLRFVNQYVSDADLLPYLRACDVYVTPYLGRDQITSGTLSYAVAAGCAVVSTPYLHAVELLAEGRGRLAEFYSPASLAHQVGALLDSRVLRQRLQQRAAAYGRSMTWPAVSRQYLELLRAVSRPRDLAALTGPAIKRPEAARPAAAPAQSRIQGA